MRYRVIFSIFVFLLSIVLIPQGIVFIGYFLKYTIRAPTLFLNELDFIGNIKVLFTDREFLYIWLSFQPIILLLISFLFWKDHFASKNKTGFFGTPKAADSGEHGTSRWRTAKEVENTTTVWRIKRNSEGKIEPPQIPKNPYSTKKSDLKQKKVAGGNVLGYNIKQNKVYLDTQDTNTLIIGTTRSGKTRTFLFPTIWELAKAKESMVLTDPKGEIHELTHKYLEKEGYDVVLLDFRDARRGNHWNVMQPVLEALKDGDQARASETAQDIAHSIVYQTERKGDPVWPNGEKSVIASTILAVATSDVPDRQKNMTNVYHNIIELGQPVVYQDAKGNLLEIIPLNDYFKSLPPGHIAKSAFGVAMLSPEKMRGSFFSSAASSLQLFADPALSYMTKIQDHDLKNIGRKPTAVFLCIPDEKTTKHVFASLYVNQVYEKLVELANECGGRIPVRVNMLLDEFGNMPAIPDFDTKVTVSLGRGVRWTLIVQDLQQLKKKYGDNATTITGNCHTWIYLLTTDVDTAKKISERTGRYTIDTFSKGASVQDRGTSRSINEGKTGRPLLTPDEILRWPAENALVFQARHHPAHLPLPDISKYKEAMEELVPYNVPYTKKIIPSEVFLLNEVNANSGPMDYEREKEIAKRTKLGSLKDKFKTNLS